MKKILGILILFLGMNISSAAFAVESIPLEKVEKSKIEVSKEQKKLTGSLLINENEMLDELSKDFELILYTCGTASYA
jgi:hypothetical protein